LDTVIRTFAPAIGYWLLASGRTSAREQGGKADDGRKAISQ
jgi:hypothetical protein